MRTLEGALFVVLVSCAAGNNPGGGGDGRATTGGAGTGSVSGGSGSGGTSRGGSAGDEDGSSGTSQSGSSGTSPGGSSGTGQGGSAGDGVAGAGGQDVDEGAVTGVVRNFFGAPNENVLIAIGSATTMTDEDGRFAIPDVAPEYDLVLVAATEPYALVIRGISERTLSLYAPGYDNFRGANLAGVVTGGAGTPIPADCRAMATFQGSSVEVMGLFGPVAPLTEGEASYAIDLFWHGPASVGGFLQALEYRVDSTGRVKSYDGFGSKAFGVSDRGVYGLPDGSIEATTIALAPVASRIVSGTVTVPPGFLPNLQVSVGPFPTEGVYGSQDTYSTVLPTGLAGIRNIVSLRAERTVDLDVSEVTSATYLVDDAVTTLDLSTPEAPAVSILPASGALGVDYDTQFSWEPPADSVSTLVFFFAQWTVRVVTTASSATIPDLSEYGATNAPGSAVIWTVESDIGPTSIDEWLRISADPAAYLNAHGKIAGTSGLPRTFNLKN